MTIVLPMLFAFSAMFALAAVWRAIAANVTLVADLRRRMSMPSCGSEIVVNLREQLAEFDPMAQVRRSRHVRHAVPKPITHRLHQFARGRDVA